LSNVSAFSPAAGSTFVNKVAASPCATSTLKTCAWPKSMTSRRFVFGRKPSPRSAELDPGIVMIRTSLPSRLNTTTRPTLAFAPNGSKSEA